MFNIYVLTAARDYNWLTATTDATTKTITYTGLPPSNDYVGDYIFVCAVTDIYLPSINFYQFKVKVSANEMILTKSINDVSIVRTELYIWPTLVTACIDPEAQTITRTLSVLK